VTDAKERHGQTLAGRYRLVDTIAVGGSGSVYQAEDTAEKRAIANKVMHSGHPDGDKERLRFEREAEIIQKLVHPHVIKLFDFGHTSDGMPFLVFPLLEGRTLQQRVKQDGAMDWQEAGRLIMQVLAALAKAHELGIAHRDIKPANIFLMPSAFGDNVQMLDFGLAKMVMREDAAEVTRSGALVGTPRYMAPEQVRGEGVSATVDIYSVGLVLAEMLIGRPVVTATKEIEIYMTHGSDEPLDLPEVVLSSPIAPIIRRAVSKPLEVRYHTASQMLADLRAVLKKMVAGDGKIGSVDMEATFIVDPDLVRPRSLPTEESEKLRDAFNRMADNKKLIIPDAAPTLVRRPKQKSVPEAAPSVPILLTRAPEDEQDTLRMMKVNVDELPSPEEVAESGRTPSAPPEPPRPSAPPSASVPPPLLDLPPIDPLAEDPLQRRSAIIAVVVVGLVFALGALSVYLTVP
jgi:serine/threonine protein kinase